MERFINVAGAQLGPIARNELRQQVVSRLLELMREAKARGSDIVVFPELALTTFFPRSWMEDDAEIDSFFEREMPSAASRPLFETAKSLGIGFYLGYAELVEQNGVAHHYNTAILVDKNAEIVGKYRKVHLPGHADNRPHYPFQHLEKRYFEPGDLGFPVWRAFGANVGMCICNDRRWPETYRVMAMQSVELILLGYNTPNSSSLDPGLRSSVRLSQPSVHAGRSLSEQHLGGRRRQSWQRGGQRAFGRQLHRRAFGRDRCPVDDQQRRGVCGQVQSRYQPVQQGDHVQFRPAPADRALPIDHSAGRRHSAAIVRWPTWHCAHPIIRWQTVMLSAAQTKLTEATRRSYASPRSNGRQD